MSPLVKGLAVLLMLLALGLGIVALRLLSAPAPAAPAMPAASAERLPAPAGTGHDVVVAARDLAAGEKLQPDMLAIARWPVAPAQGYADPQALAGETTRLAVAKGEALTAQALARGLARSLGEGERALTLPVDEAAAAQPIAPGDYVDVFLVPERAPAGGSATLLQARARVLAYGAGSLDQLAGAPARPVGGRNIVLAVPAAEVGALLAAVRQGRLQLALRAPGDRSLPEPPMPPPAEAAPPPPEPAQARAPRRVEIVRGGRREVVQY